MLRVQDTLFDLYSSNVRFCRSLKTVTSFLIMFFIGTLMKSEFLGEVLNIGKVGQPVTAA